MKLADRLISWTANRLFDAAHNLAVFGIGRKARAAEKIAKPGTPEGEAGLEAMKQRIYELPPDSHSRNLLCAMRRQAERRVNRSKTPTP